MNKGYTRPAVWGDVSYIAQNMREADKAEILAASGSTPEQALTKGLLATAFGGRTTTVCLPDDTPVAMLGVLPAGQPDVGLVWMLASNDLKNIQTQFLRESRRQLAEITDGYRVVYNYTDARNTLHHRWLKWTGFKFIQRHEQWGLDGQPFFEVCKITETRYV